MAQKIIGIEIGAYQIKVFQLGGDEAQGAKLHRQKRRRAEKQDEDKQLLIQTLKAMKGAGQFEADWVVAGFSGVQTQALRLDAPFADESKLAAILPGLLDAALPFDTDSLSYTWELQKGKSGKPEIFVIYTKTSQISEELDLLMAAGVDPRYLIWAPAAGHYFRSLAIKSHMGDLVATVEIGHNHTCIALTHKGHLVAARTIPKGGHQVTLALAQHLNCQYGEAEKLKHSGLGLLATNDNLPPDEAAVQRALHDAYDSICLGVIQTVRSFSDAQNLKLDGVILGGGASGVTGLDSYIGKKLNAPVLSLLALQNNPGIRTQAYNDPILKALEGNPDGLVAAGLALAGRHKGKLLGNLRVGHNRWKGQFDAVKQRSKSISVWVSLLAISLVANCSIKNSVLSSEISAIESRQSALCKRITGKQVDSFSRCRAIMQNAGSLGDDVEIPDFSAGDIYVELARLIPADKNVKITEVDITDNKVRLRGTTASFENVDAVVAQLDDGKCFSTVEKGRATQREGQIEFNVNIGLDCEGAAL